jgi:predicted protein tyrosine phosphatase
MMKIELMKKCGISQVLKVNETSRVLFPLDIYGITLKEVYLEDTPDYELDVENEIKPCLQFIHQGMLKKQGTLVVCTAGMSRSATVCIAYMMYY